ncbi:MAG: hypothetical protein ACXWQZ_07545, partial [Ktedonobacterales bacterium]
DNVHAPNEKYSIPNFYHLIRQAVRFLDIVGTDPAIVSRPQQAAHNEKANGRKKSAPADGWAEEPAPATVG